MMNKSYLLTLLFGLTSIMPASVVSASVTDQVIGDVRVQPLSSTLVRIELKGPAGFEDRPTLHITGRDMPGTNTVRSVEGGTTVIATDSYVVRVPSAGADLNGIVITDLTGQELWSMPYSSEYTTIKCRWEGMGVKYLCDGGDMVSYGDTPADDSYFWILENADGYIQIRNKATGDYMNIENNRDYVECNAVQSHWTSKDWSMQIVDGFQMIRCRWIDHRDYMHTENSTGYLEHAPAGTTNGSGTAIEMWWSSLWQSDSVTSDFFTNNRYWLPHLQDETQAWAICDTPRYVPASWGYDPAPASSDNYQVNGWDLANDSKDVYVFLPQGDSRRLREDYISLIGRADLLPLYAFGGWDSRYYPYTQQEALDKIDRYRAEQIPLDVFVVDTDWRVGASHGYGVNTALFPDMEQFLTDAHAKNVKITFNDHPEPQADMALDPVEVNYRNEGLRGLFDIGLDFWWFDRNWHTSLLPPLGINKEVFGMYIFHWITKSYYPERRPIIMANFDGIDNGAINRAPNMGAYRYSMQWTGDTHATFAELTREISDAVYTGAYTPFAYLSTDLGGHNGEPSVEQYCRWVQYGALSPIFRLHCTAGQIRDPWAYGVDALRIVRDFVQMRMRLLPVFYTAARNNYETGEPILRRCDLDYPAYPQASDNTQYLLGKDILVAPVCQPDDTVVPADMFTGGVYAEYYANMTLSDSPALTRSENDIAFNWGTDRPASGLPRDAFSARFTATLTVNTDTAIELGISSDDGSRLWINDQLVVDRWVDQAEALYWSGVACEPGESYIIKVEYFENAGDAVCKLNYRNFNASSVERALWLPPGLWLDCWTGAKLTGPADIVRATTLDEIPLFVRSGSIIPLAPDMQYSSQRPWDNVILDVYPDDASVAIGSLYEDDTISNGYQMGQCRTTAFSAAVDPELKTVTVTIDAAQGGYAGALAQRSWTVRLRQPLNWNICHAVNSVMVDGMPVAFEVIARDQAAMPFAVTGPAADSDLIVIELPACPVDQPRTVEVQFDTQWQGQNIGQSSINGSFLRSQGQYTITGSGSGLGLFQDSFYFVSDSVLGNSQIVARHISTDVDASAGVIWRGTLSEGSPFVALDHKSGSLRFSYRNVTGLPAVTTLVADNIAEPLWLKIVRFDNTFNCYSSFDGIDWVNAGNVNFVAPMSGNLGLNVSGVALGGNALARFDSVEVIDALSADIDGDGQIDMSDLSLLVANWLSADCPADNWCQRADLNMDGIVDLSDISVLFSGYTN